MGGTGRGIGTDETVSTGGIAKGDGKSYELAVGTMVGEYRIEGDLGAGGMGKVYAATHPVIAKRAAIKVLHPELSVNTEAVERFIQEARSVNQIGHPNIVDIFAFGVLPDGRSYFVMEWLRGESLRDRMKRGVPPIIETLQILDTIAVALEAAHEKGIVHRDLKPDNVFLVEIKGKEAQVKLLDFGIAKLLGSDDLRAERTRTGNLLGTPAYISPEQARGYAVDHRTDVYALGALAYEMLTAWLPFPADNAADMIAKHLFEPPPRASVHNPQVTPEVDDLIIAMMSKDANARPTLEQVREQLRVFFNQVLVTGPTGAHGPMRMSPNVGLRSNSSIGVQHAPVPMQHTPPPGTQTGPGAVGAYQSAMTGPPPKKSKAALFVVGGLLAAGLGVGVFVAVTNSGTKDTSGSAATGSAATAGDSTTPGDSTQPGSSTANDSTKPGTTTAGDSKPSSTTATDSTKPNTTATATTKPADPTLLTGSTKPTGSVPTGKPVDKTAAKKRPPKTGGKPKTGTKGGTTPVDDPDAPM